MKPEQTVTEIIVGLVDFPNAEICRHSVIVDLLTALEHMGFTIPDDLYGAAVDSDDDEIMKLLKKVKGIEDDWLQKDSE